MYNYSLDIPIGEQLFINYGEMGNLHLLQKFGFTLPDNPYSRVPFYYNAKKYAEMMGEEIELKFRLYQHTGISHFMHGFMFYKNKFDINIMKSLRIAFLTSDMVRELTLDHLWNHETFENPISSTQEEVILNTILGELEEALEPLEGKDYVSMRNNLGEFDSIRKVHKYNILNYQIDEQVILKKNIRFVEKMRDEVLRQRRALTG